jgi:hypothetical protein
MSLGGPIGGLDIRGRSFCEAGRVRSSPPTAALNRESYTQRGRPDPFPSIPKTGAKGGRCRGMIVTLRFSGDAAS